MTEDGRRFTEEEFAEILRRASEMQARLPAAGAGEQGEPSGAQVAPPRGMSLGEVESIAREVGIDPVMVRRAATALAAEDVSFQGTSWERFVLKRSAAGEMDRDDLVRVLQAVRDATGVPGDTVSRVSGVEWKGGDVVKTVVSADSLDGNTELRVAVDATGARILSHLFPGLAGLLTSVAVGATLEPGVAVGMAILAGGVGTGLGVGHLIWRRVLSRTRENAARVFRAGVAALASGGSGVGDEGPDGDR